MTERIPSNAKTYISRDPRGMIRMFVYGYILGGKVCLFVYMESWLRRTSDYACEK